MVKKLSEYSKDVIIIKTFHFGTEPNNIINHILNYYEINCQSEFTVLINDKAVGNYNAKETSKILRNTQMKEYAPKYQIVDARFKCKYFITQSNYIIPTMPSGSIYNLNIVSSFDKYVQDFATTSAYLKELTRLTTNIKPLLMNPIGVFYREKKEKSYIITAIMTESYDAVPIVERSMTVDYIKKEQLLVQSKPNDDIIDKEIIKGPDNIVIDNRIYHVAKNEYQVELYQLFRYHLSYYLNNVPTGIKYNERLETLIKDTDMPKRKRKLEIKKLLYQRGPAAPPTPRPNTPSRA